MAPPPHPHPAAGQGSLEYVGLLALVSTALAVAAGPAAGLAGVPGQVAEAVRTGVCIAGGDVCRASDAAAAGLAPCTVADRLRGGGLAVTVLSVKVGGEHEFLVAQRSDGSVAVTKVARDDLAASGGLGFEAGPLKVGVDGEAGLRVASGVGWEFADAGSARRFLAAAREGLSPAVGRWPVAWRSGEAALATSGWAGLGVRSEGKDGAAAEGRAAGIELAAGSAIGARIGRGRTTVYVRAETTGPRSTGVLAGLLDAGPAGPVLAEYTRDEGGPRELAFRTSARGARRGEVVETVARLDLRVEANRAVAARLLRHRAPWPPAVAADLRAAIAQAVRTGTVERSVYAVEDGSRSFTLAGRLGMELGVEGGYAKVDRRLVAASAWTAGSRERAREDCLPGRARLGA